MINFFRKTRKNLADKNPPSGRAGKPMKYFRYAVGEIVLVMVGILLALQVNNWNIARLESKKEQLYLINLKRDLVKQSNAIKYNISGEEIVEKSLSLALETYVNNKGFLINTENLIDIAPINDRYTFNVIKPTYMEMLSTGNLDVLSDISLKDKLLEYYSTLELTSQIIQNNNNQKDNSILFISLRTIEPYGPNVNYDKPTVRGSFDNYQTPDHILELIKQTLKDPKNELALFNSIRYRRNLSYWHIKKLKSSLDDTQNLLEQIND